MNHFTVRLNPMAVSTFRRRSTTAMRSRRGLLPSPFAGPAGRGLPDFLAALDHEREQCDIVSVVAAQHLSMK
jgi:hypothetical protein